MSLKIVKIDEKNKYNFVDKNNWKCMFHVLCAQGNLEAIKSFVEQGFDINEEIQMTQKHVTRRVSGFELACKEGNLNIAKFLSLNGVDFQKLAPFRIMWLAIQSGNVHLVQFLMNLGFCERLQQHQLIELFRSTHEKIGDYAMTKLCLDLGVNFNAIKFDKVTFFHSACRSNVDNVDFLNWLINQGSDINLVDWRGWNAFDYACDGGNVKVVKFLVKKGFDINQITENGTTGFHRACRSGNVKIVKFLVEKGFDFNKTTLSGKTGFHLAGQGICECRRAPHFEIIQYLCQSGYDVNRLDMNGKTVLTILSRKLRMGPFAREDREEGVNTICLCILLLLEHGAQINVRGLFNSKMRLVIKNRIIEISCMKDKIFQTFTGRVAQTICDFTMLPISNTSAKTTLQILRIISNSNAIDTKCILQ